ncbi:MAG: glutathione-dependent formaldehyde dehydrogenase [Acidobacteriota bacterium]|nr:glutathione-dependent formaldehyde dehydrogenase [Acidobacteriota bacterium]
MKALCWQGKNSVSVESVPDPKILNPRDAIIKITSTAICGSDLHLYNGYIPTMQKGDILGHENMGEVVEVGSEVKNLKKGDRIVTPFTISCGNCYFCKKELFSLCDNSNPNAWMAEKLYGYSPSGLFGYSHMLGGYAGGQAEYLRIPFADVGHVKIPEGMPDDKVLFLSDIFPTAWMAAENCQIEPGDTVAIWGAGPVGLLAIKSAYLQGAERVISIESVEDRMNLAREAGAEVIDFNDEKGVIELLKEMTGGRGPDSCMDAVGMEAHGTSMGAIYDRIKTATFMATDRPNVLRQAVTVCRKGGTVSVPGVYGGMIDKFPMGAFVNKGLTMKSGQTHVHRYLKPLLNLIQEDKIDPSFIITHRMTLDEAPDGYETFKHRIDNCIKIVLKPNGASA